MEDKTCDTCKWYDPFWGVCFNGKSDYCADEPPAGWRCELWEEDEDEQSDVGS